MKISVPLAERTIGCSRMPVISAAGCAVPIRSSSVAAAIRTASGEARSSTTPPTSDLKGSCGETSFSASRSACISMPRASTSASSGVAASFPGACLMP